MNKRNSILKISSSGLLAIVLLVSQLVSAQENAVPGAGFAAIPGQRGGQDIYGPYEVVPNWPKPMGESLPGHDDWTWSVTMDVFAESADRVFLVQKGELPLITDRADTIWLPQLGVGYHYPNFRLPLRQAGG